jgi:hypothetical protein
MVLAENQVGDAYIHSPTHSGIDALKNYTNTYSLEVPEPPDPSTPIPPMGLKIIR